MRIDGAVALVTGANRGLGRELVSALLCAGARTVYATARDPARIAPRTNVVPLQVDVTDPATIATAAARASDVTLLINNAGVLTAGSAIDQPLDVVRRTLETNLFGPLNMARAFAPVIEANGGGTIVNILSLLSLHNAPFAASYCISKSAAWAMTQSLRSDLARHRVLVAAAFPGGIDTDMLAGIAAEKADPAKVALAIVAGVASGTADIYPDPVSARYAR